MSIQTHDLVTMLREASHVKRCHTMAIIGEYTVGQHSFDMVTLLLALHPHASRELIIACLAHDLAERWVGDIPAPTKWSDPMLNGHLEKLEHSILDKLGLNVVLNPIEARWLHGLDRVELLLWSKDQLAMGNQSAANVVAALLRWFQNNELPEALKRFVENHKWQRTPDTIPS